MKSPLPKAIVYFFIFLVAKQNVIAARCKKKKKTFNLKLSSSSQIEISQKNRLPGYRSWIKSGENNVVTRNSRVTRFHVTFK